MKKPWEIIAEIESDNSRLHKESVIRREALAKNDVLFAGLNLAFNAYITFGVAKIPQKNATDKTGSGLDWKTFEKSVALLVERKSTGNDARKLVEDLMSASTLVEWNGWYRRILLKDMRAGFTDGTVNRICYGDYKKEKWVPGIAPQYRIQTYECQLAEDADNNPNAMRGKKQIDTKMDGNRMQVHVFPGMTAEAFSRNGKELLNFPHIVDQLVSIAGQLKEPMVFDGEVMSATFQDLMRQVRRKTNVNAKDAIFYMFDWLPLADFKAGLCKTPQHKRSETLRAFYEKNAEALSACSFLEYETIDLDTKAGRDRLEELRKIAADRGAEGVMVKDPDASYQCKRSDKWLKIKPVITVDLKIADVQLGEEGKKNEHRMGNIVCEGIDKGKHILVNVSNKFTDEMREEWWKNRKKLVGRTVEIEADAITKAQNSATYSLRFPRFIRFRDDK